MADTKDPQHKGPETLNVQPSHVQLDPAGHVTITDPKVAQLIKQKTGAGHGALKADGVSVGVVVSKSF